MLVSTEQMLATAEQAFGMVIGGHQDVLVQGDQRMTANVSNRCGRKPIHVVSQLDRGVDLIGHGVFDALRNGVRIKTDLVTEVSWVSPKNIAKFASTLSTTSFPAINLLRFTPQINSVLETKDAQRLEHPKVLSLATKTACLTMEPGS